MFSLFRPDLFFTLLKRLILRINKRRKVVRWLPLFASPLCLTCFNNHQGNTHTWQVYKGQEGVSYDNTALSFLSLSLSLSLSVYLSAWFCLPRNKILSPYFSLSLPLSDPFPHPSLSYYDSPSCISLHTLPLPTIAFSLLTFTPPSSLSL